MLKLIVSTHASNDSSGVTEFMVGFTPVLIHISGMSYSSIKRHNNVGFVTLKRFFCCADESFIINRRSSQVTIISNEISIFVSS